MMQKWFKFSLVALFGCGFVALILYVFLMKDSIRNAQMEPPLIMAAEEPVKRHPEQPGGLVIPDQDKLVFDLLDEKGNLASGSVVQNIEIEDELAVAEVEPVSETVAAVEAIVVAAEPSKTVAEVVEKVDPVVAAKPVEEPKIEPKTEPVQKVTAGGAWGVQLGSVRVQADAQAALGKLANQFAALKPLQGRVQAADVKGKTSYRIQFVGLESRDKAAELCRRLGSGQACLPVSR